MRNCHFSVFESSACEFHEGGGFFCVGILLTVGGFFRHGEGILLAVVDFSAGANFNERICSGSLARANCRLKFFVLILAL